jgi:putative FmdB family regulatory protein
MPLYEYECAACGSRFELIRKFSDEPVEVCPACGKKDVQKLLSSPAIQFKGTGWYITDYAKKGPAPADGAAKPAAKDTDTKSSPSDSSGSASSSGSTDATPATPSSKQS